MSNNKLKKTFQKLVTQSCETWNIPNLTYALIKNQEIIDIKSCVLDNPLSQNASVDKIYRIGSNSKAFACTALVELEQQDKLSLDDPVTNYLPNFQLCNEELTKQIKVRDLVNHRTGAAKYGSCLLGLLDYSKTDIIESLRYTPQVQPYNTSFQYNNALYIVTGDIIEKVTGIDNHQYFKEQLFIPNNMHHTYTSLEQLHQPFLAVPHIEHNGKIIAISQSLCGDAFTVGGNINSTASDLANWLLFNLKITTDKSNQLYHYHRLFQEQIPILQPVNLNCLNKYIKVSSYLLGWYQAHYKKHMVVEHIGGSPGYMSNISFCPELNAGIVLLSNKCDIWYPLDMLRINFYELITENNHTNLIPAIKKQCNDFSKKLNKTLSFYAPQALPIELRSISLKFYNKIYKQIIFYSDSNKAYLEISPKKIKIPLEYVGKNNFKLIDENFSFEFLLKLVMFKISNNYKNAKLEIYVGDQHGGLMWVDTQTFEIIQ